MPWFKVDDQLAFHSKTMLAGNEAMGLWVRAGAWSSAHFTDGFIPEHMATAMAQPMAKTDLPSFAIDLPSRLVEAGFWHKVEGGYQFHDWEDFQPDGKAEKQRQEDTRKARSEAGKRGAEARWGKKKTDGKDMAKPMANAMAKNGKANGKPMAPSRPVPSFKERDKPSLSSHFPNASETKPAPEFSDDVKALAEHLRDWIVSNGNRKPNITKTWLQAIDRLIRIDGYTPAQIRQVIDWSQSDEFWQGNILSASKLRKHFDQLKNRMMSERNRHNRDHMAPGSVRALHTLQLGERLQAQEDQGRRQIAQ